MFMYMQHIGLQPQDAKKCQNLANNNNNCNKNSKKANTTSSIFIVNQCLK